MTNKVNWFHIMVLVSFYHLANYLGFSYITQNEKRSNKNPSIEDKSILLFLNVLLNFSSTGFYLLFGLRMDHTIKIDQIVFYIIFWFFFTILIFKGLYKNKKVGIQIIISSKISAGIINGKPDSKVGFMTNAVQIKSMKREREREPRELHN